MKYIKNFDGFINNSNINESKESRAERKKRKALGLVDDIQDAISDNNYKKAERLIKRANDRLEKAKELNPNIEIETANDEIKNLEKEIVQQKEEDSKDNFQTKKTHFFRDKIKADKFPIINKIKIIGDEISNDEVQTFLKTVKSYIEEYWNELQNDGDFPKEYQNDDNNLEIHLKRKFGRTVFLYKEGINDKIKIVFSNKDFDEDNKDKILLELDDVLDSENIKTSIDDNYEEQKDDHNNVKSNVELKNEPSNNIVEPVVNNKEQIEKIAEILITKDDNFINSAVNLLIEEELNISYSNTDEDAIYDFFVKKHPTKSIVAENIDDILINYKKKKSSMLESWYNNADDFNDATIGATKRGTQSMRTTESKGVVSDLMWAFNSDAKTLNDDINKALLKLSQAYQQELNKSIDMIAKKVLKEDIDSTSLITGMIGSGYMLKNSPKLAKMIGMRGGGALASSNVARGGLMGLSRMGSALANPYVWIGIAIVVTVTGGWLLWNSIDKQQNQLATIFLIMLASGSKEFQKELKQNGINPNFPKINLDKLNSLIKSGDVYGKGEENISNTNIQEIEKTSEQYIKKFKDFKK